MIWVWRKKEHFSFRTEVLSLSYQMNFGPTIWIVGCRWVFTHGTECAGAGFRRTCRKDFLQKFCNFVFGAQLHHRQLGNITFSSNFGTATRQNSFLNWKGTTTDESVSQGSMQNYRKHFNLSTIQNQQTLISRYWKKREQIRESVFELEKECQKLESLTHFENMTANMNRWTPVPWLLSFLSLSL